MGGPGGPRATGAGTGQAAVVATHGADIYIYRYIFFFKEVSVNIVEKTLMKQIDLDLEVEEDLSIYDDRGRGTGSNLEIRIMRTGVLIMT